MNSRKAGILIVVISLICAAAITISDYFLEGTPFNQAAMYTIIVVWFAPFSWLSVRAVKNEKLKSGKSRRT